MSGNVVDGFKLLGGVELPHHLPVRSRNGVKHSIRCALKHNSWDRRRSCAKSATASTSRRSGRSKCPLNLAACGIQSDETPSSAAVVHMLIIDRAAPNDS